jgi:hypothetical protein
LFQALSAVELSEIAVEVPQWGVPILAGSFENEEIGEAYSLVLGKLLKCSLDDVRVLDGKVLATTVIRRRSVGAKASAILNR